MQICEKLIFFVTIKSTQLEGKQSTLPSEQVIVNAFLFSIVSTMIEQRLIWGGGALWVDSGASGD